MSNFETIEVYISVLAILAILSVVTLQDIRTGKISNRILMYGVCVWFLLAVAAMIIGAITGISNYYVSIIHSAINASVSFALGFLLWKYGIWAAGDGKLFALMALLIPAHFYSASSLPVFRSFSLLINVFVLYLVINFVMAFTSVMLWEIDYVFKNSLRISLINLKSRIVSFDALRLFWSILFGMVIIQVIQFAVRSSPITTLLDNNVFVFMIFFLSRRKLNQLFQNREYQLVSYFICFNLLTYLFIMNRDVIITMIKQILFHSAAYMVIITTLKFFIERQVNIYETKTVNKSSLKIGYVLTPETIERLRHNGIKISQQKPEGLSQEDIDVIRDHDSDIQDMKVYKLHPFSAYIAGGVLLTLFLKMSVIRYFFS